MIVDCFSDRLALPDVAFSRSASTQDAGNSVTHVVRGVRRQSHVSRLGCRTSSF